ncbi:S1 RNA-binding domain-containing protein, partial [Patescibacteria group bacterium]|nr:S1 RNA-binding domain-containing protein [Patescibacteria group bacterium]
SDGLVHKSQMANYYVTNPTDVVSVGQNVKVTVIGIEPEREKVSLSMKTGDGLASINVDKH